tara:strand:- start:7809 stop:9059 length:1251 start_codon:yes stop_codon:yes gene_type:complete
MAEKIKIIKDSYLKSEYKGVIDTNFSELANNQESEIDLESFFREYDDLFFNIPLEGTLSHRTLVLRSSGLLDDLDDPRDKEIDNLRNRVSELELELLQRDESSQEPEHPQFKNGSLLHDPTTGENFFMSKGKTRKIFDSNVLDVLKQLQPGGTIDSSVRDVATLVPTSIVNGIENGIPLNEANFNLIDSTVDDETQRAIWNIDWSDATLNLDYARTIYNDVFEYLEVLAKDIDAKEKVLEFVEEKILNINRRINALRVQSQKGSPSLQSEVNAKIEELRQQKNDLSDTLDSTEVRLDQVKQAFITLDDQPSLFSDLPGGGEDIVDNDNPEIRYGHLKDNLQKLFDEGALENNNISGPQRDLRQAKEKERDGKSVRKFNAWKTDIDKRSSSKDQRDLIVVLRATRNSIRETGEGRIQ